MHFWNSLLCRRPLHILQRVLLLAQRDHFWRAEHFEASAPVLQLWRDLYISKDCEVFEQLRVRIPRAYGGRIQRYLNFNLVTLKLFFKHIEAKSARGTFPPLLVHAWTMTREEPLAQNMLLSNARKGQIHNSNYILFNNRYVGVTLHRSKEQSSSQGLTVVAHRHPLLFPEVSSDPIPSVSAYG